jgi:NAD(P)-dependent dehydrogenase (short-subunit alcohol dehydrogenase family)
MQIYDRRKKAIALKRPGLPDDISHMAAFLASDDANFIGGPGDERVRRPDPSRVTP